MTRIVVSIVLLLAAAGSADALDRAAVAEVRAESRAAREAEDLGDADTARAHLERAVAVARERLAGTIHEANAIDALAYAHLRAGRDDDAVPLYVESLARYRTLLRGDQPRIATSLHNLAVVEWRSGRIEDAEAHAREALALWERLPATRAAGHEDTRRLLDRLAAEPPREDGDRGGTTTAPGAAGAPASGGRGTPAS